MNKFIADAGALCESQLMRKLLLLPLAFGLFGCIVGTIAETAVDVVTLPVKAAAKTVDLATTSQAEADQKRGRAVREEEERRGRALRAMEQRCRAGRPLATDVCAPTRR